MLSSTRLLSLALLLVSTLNVAAAPTPMTQDGDLDLAESQLPQDIPDSHPALMERAPTKKPAKPKLSVTPPASSAHAPKSPTKAAKSPTAKSPTAPKQGANPPANKSGTKQPTSGKGKGKGPTPPGTPKSPSRPTTPPPKKAKGAPKAQKCNTILDCKSCLAKQNKCHFDKVAFTCTDQGGANKVTNAIGCLQMAQMQKVFSTSKPPGVVPSDLTDKFNKVRPHVFVGETTDKNSGRHTLTSFLQTHPGAKGTENNKNKLKEFSLGPKNVKTVWDNSAGGYTEIDIKNMCVTAAKVLGTGGGKGGTVGVAVQSPFGTPACITFAEFSAGPKSCFPLGTADPRKALGSTCTGSSTD